jgi:acyl carrier protein
MTTDRERALRDTLASFLSIDPGSLTASTNLFELGIDSLLGLRLIRKLNETLDLDLELDSLFDHPTLGELAQAIDARLATPS